MPQTQPLHNTPEGVTRIYWDAKTEGHHFYHLQTIARFIESSDEHLALSQPAADELDSGVRATLEKEGRLHIVEHWELGVSQFIEFRRIRDFIGDFGTPCKIVLVTACEMQWAIAWGALNPFTRKYARSITGNYYRARALGEKDQSFLKWAKYLLTKTALRAWASALPKGTFIGSLVRTNVDHYNQQALLKDRFRLVHDFCAFGSDACPPPEPGDRDSYTICTVGSQVSRKGTLFALNAIREHYSLNKPLKVIVAGMIRQPELREAVKQESEHVSIEVHDRFISDDEVASIFSRSDLCLMPYIQFYSSSGVLILSANHHRPVLASDIGQVASDVQTYGLGQVFPVADAKAFVGKLEEMLTRQARLEPSNRDRYLTDCSPEGHMQTLRAI